MSRTRGQEAELIAIYEKAVAIGHPADTLQDEKARQDAEQDDDDDKSKMVVKWPINCSKPFALVLSVQRGIKLSDIHKNPGFGICALGPFMDPGANIWALGQYMGPGPIHGPWAHS